MGRLNCQSFGWQHVLGSGFLGTTLVICSERWKIWTSSLGEGGKTTSLTNCFHVMNFKWMNFQNKPPNKACLTLKWKSLTYILGTGKENLEKHRTLGDLDYFACEFWVINRCKDQVIYSVKKLGSIWWWCPVGFWWFLALTLHLTNNYQVPPNNLLTNNWMNCPTICFEPATRLRCQVADSIRYRHYLAGFEKSCPMATSKPSSSTLMGDFSGPKVLTKSVKLSYIFISSSDPRKYGKDNKSQVLVC